MKGLEMRTSWIHWIGSNCTGKCLVKEVEKTEKGTHSETQREEDNAKKEAENWGEAASSPGTLKIARSHQKLGGSHRTILPQSLQKEQLGQR